jgi:hypothetical protein
MRAGRARVIVLAGAVRSGKTTILTSLFESFASGPFAGLRFAGSRTLPGFEQLCHLSRIASGREEADTPRTPLGPMGFLHLRLRDPGELTTVRDILVTDVSGETFRLARDVESESRKLTVLQRADHLAVVLDGARLANLQTRTRIANDARALLRSCLESNMIGSRTMVELIVSKYDVIQRAEGSANLQYLSSVREQISSAFSNQVGDLAWHEVAARPSPPDGTLPFAYGLETLLTRWVTSTRLYQAMPSMEITADEEKLAISEFDRLQWRSR